MGREAEDNYLMSITVVNKLLASIGAKSMKQ